jgi:DNA-directed RNA polymerase sigma subunit (sigma70/sigma32)
VNGADGGEPRSLLIAAGQAIICGSDRGMMMGHLSVATIEALNKILRTCRNMRHAIGREPTPSEIAARLGMPPETIRKLLGAPPTLTRH